MSQVGQSGQEGTATGVAERMGFKPGMVIQELGWDNDTDDELRVAIEDCIDADMVDGDYGNVVDAVILWWRDEDGDLVDGLVDSLTDLVAGGPIWLLTPKIGRPNAVDAADVAEAVRRLEHATEIVPSIRSWRKRWISAVSRCAS